MACVSELLKKKNLSVGIFGVGESNAGVEAYLKSKNPSFRLTVRSDKKIDASAFKDAERFFTGEDALNDIDEDVLFLSPSVRRERKEILKAQERGVLISSDADFFFELTDKAPVSVTGSDGKSTTTHLIAKAYSLSGYPAIPCGNYGISLCSVLDKNAFAVSELSSFQLNYAKPRSSYAVITNITPNHLNWHTSLEEYIQAKMNVTENAEKIIFDADSPILAKALANREVFCKSSLLFDYSRLKATGGSENYVTFKNDIIYINESAFCDISNAKRKEPYNIRNFMITVAACIDKCHEKAITDAIVNFSGLRHRAELFFEHDGIKYIDSSIDSSPERTIKTLSALSDKAIVIIGGMGKGLSLDELARSLPILTEGAILLGDVGNNLAEILSAQYTSYAFSKANDLTDAITKAKELLNGCGTIILSPAATSFDRYKNFVERGNDFKTVVLKSSEKTP